MHFQICKYNCFCLISTIIFQTIENIGLPFIIITEFFVIYFNLIYYITIFNFYIPWITYLSICCGNSYKIIVLGFFFFFFSRIFICCYIISIMIYKSVISCISPCINCFFFIFEASPISVSLSFWDVVLNIIKIFLTLPTSFKMICTYLSNRLILFPFISWINQHLISSTDNSSSVFQCFIC